MLDNDICDAIADKKIVTFLYKKKERVAEPHLLYLNTNGAVILLAWQLSPKQGFRSYRIAKATSFSITEDSFPEPRPGFHRTYSSTLQGICCSI